MHLRLLTAAALAITLAPSVSIADEAFSVEEAGVKKINISGRQRMLSQRMSKAACFRHLGVGDAAHIKQVRDAHQLFETSLKGLIEGANSLGLPKETDAAILEELAKVQALWAEFGPIVESAGTANSVDSDLMQQIAERNLELLVQANKAVQAIEKRYADGVIDPNLAAAVNVAGRQRMLSQRAAKEFCLIAAGIDVANQRESLAKTIALFDNSLAKLRKGDADAGIVAPLTDDMDFQYELVQGLWDRYRPALELAVTEVPPEDAIQLVAGINNALLTEMNVAVFMYTSNSEAG